MYELIIILFLTSLAMNIGLGILRVKSLRVPSQKLVHSFDFTLSYKYQMHNLLFNIVRDGIVGIIILVFILFKVPALVDSIFLKLNFGGRISDILTIAILLFVSSMVMFTFESIKKRYLKSHSFDFFPPTQKLFSLWCIRFLLILVPTMVFVITFNSLDQNSDKVFFSFIATLITGSVSYNLYSKLTYKVDKSHNISINSASEKLLKETSNYDFKIYKMITPYSKKFANAFAIKIKKTHQIWVSKDLLVILNEHETLSIIAHEIGHHIKKHNQKRKLLFGFRFIYHFLIAKTILIHDELYNSFGYDRVSGAFALITVFVLYGFFNRFFLMWSNYIFRKLEYVADNYSSKFNGSDNLSKALLKTYQFNLMAPNLHPIDEFLNSPHPSLINRLKAIKYAT